jgi:hypothetical protein
MAIERDHQTGHLARIEVLLAEAKRTVANIPATDRVARASIAIHLDKLLNELRGPYEGQPASRLTARRS